MTHNPSRRTVTLATLGAAALPSIALASKGKPMSDRKGSGQRQRAKVLMSNDPKTRALQEQNGFSDAVVIDGDVILSGIVTELEAGQTDLKAAYTKTFKTIEEILKRAGAGWDDVLEIHTFHTDIASQLAPFVEVKKLFVQVPHPAWTAIGISKLVIGITETRVTAKLATGSR